MEKKSLISSRYVISKRDKRQLLQKINKYYKGKILEYISSAKKVEVVKTRIEGIVIIMVNSRPLLFSIKDKLIKLFKIKVCASCELSGEHRIPECRILSLPQAFKELKNISLEKFLLLLFLWEQPHFG